MEIRVLKYFLAVAHEESVSKAAEVLHITQPTLSRQLMQLESALGVCLFKRGRTKIILTDEGRLLQRRAQEIVELADKAERELAGNRFIEGEIAIGSGELHSMHVLSGIMKRFREAYPRVSYSLYSGNADDIKERIDKGLIDIGLLAEPADIAKYEFIRTPHRETWGILIRKDSPLADKAAIGPSDLVGTPVLITSRGIVQNELADWFGEYFERLEVFATYNLIYNASIMVENGLGAAICLERLVRESDGDNLCFRPFSPHLSTGAVIVWKKNQIFPPVVARFLEQIKYALQA